MSRRMGVGELVATDSYYDVTIDYYDEIFPHDEYRETHQPVRDSILAALGTAADIPVLDLCCGTGRGLAVFSNDPRFRLIGTDVRQDMLDKAQANYPMARLIHSDILDPHTPVRDEEVRCVTLIGACIQMFAPTQRADIHKLAYHVLDDGGVYTCSVLLRSPVPDSPIVSVKQHIPKSHSDVVFLHHYRSCSKHPQDPFELAVYRLTVDHGALEGSVAVGRIPIYPLQEAELICELQCAGFDVQDSVRTKGGGTAFIIARKQDAAVE